MFLICGLAYLVIAFLYGLYVYFDTLKDLRFRGGAFEISFWFGLFWPATISGMIYISIIEHLNKESKE